MSLKKLNIGTEVKPKAKNEIPVFVVNNDITRYNEACLALVEAEATVKELRPAIEQAGFKRLVDVNVSNPYSPLSSVKLEDPSGAKVRVTMAARYKVANADVASHLFEELNDKDGNAVDVNTYVHETVKASFDSSVFMRKTSVTNPDTGEKLEVSEFVPAIYEAFKTAIEGVAKKLGVPSPLSSTTVCLPKPEFHKLRWAKFDVESNLKIQESLPAVVSVADNV
jgi:hypothetical protein